MNKPKKNRAAPERGSISERVANLEREVHDLKQVWRADQSALGGLRPDLEHAGNVERRIERFAQVHAQGPI